MTVVKEVQSTGCGERRKRKDEEDTNLDRRLIIRIHICA